MEMVNAAFSALLSREMCCAVLLLTVNPTSVRKAVAEKVELGKQEQHSDPASPECGCCGLCPIVSAAHRLGFPCVQQRLLCVLGV